MTAVHYRGALSKGGVGEGCWATAPLKSKFKKHTLFNTI
jgi:hypothetical protein